MKNNNPAARLHKLLTDLKSKFPPESNINEALQENFNLSKEGQLEILTAIARIYTLTASVESAVLACPELDHDLNLTWRDSIISALGNMRWNGPLGLFYDQLSESALLALEFVADNLSRHAPEKTLSDDDLHGLREEAWALYERLSSCDIDARTRSYLLKHLLLVIQALDDYPFYGITPLETALNASIGSTFPEQESAIASRQCDEGNAFWRLIGRVAVILKVVQAVLQIGDSTVNLLEGAEIEPGAAVGEKSSDDSTANIQ